jgi:hypothetical protein
MSSTRSDIWSLSRWSKLFRYHWTILDRNVQFRKTTDLKKWKTWKRGEILFRKCVRCIVLAWRSFELRFVLSMTHGNRKIWLEQNYISQAWSLSKGFWCNRGFQLRNEAFESMFREGLFLGWTEESWVLVHRDSPCCLPRFLSDFDAWISDRQDKRLFSAEYGVLGSNSRKSSDHNR